MNLKLLSSLLLATSCLLAQAQDAKLQKICLGDTQKPRFEVRDISWPATPDAAEICLWKGDKLAACSITIDDNCKPDLKWWLAMCEKYDLVVTHFLITDKIGGRNAGFDGTWDDWRAFHATGRSSLQSHTTNHIRPSKAPEGFSLSEAYLGAVETINANVPGNRCLAMAAPFGESNRDLIMAHFVANRGTYGTPNVASRINYASTAVGSLSQACIDVITTGSTTNPPAWLNRKHYYRGWISPLYHYVKGDQNPDANPAEEDLKRLAAVADKVWIGFFADIARYGQERDTATLTTTVSNTSITLSLSDEMKDDLFDVPLTVKVRLPDGWTSATATQNNRPASITLVPHEGSLYALVDCIPDRGPTLITPK